MIRIAFCFMIGLICAGNNSKALQVISADPVGLGGGGAMYRPTISPHNPNLIFVACDMGGLYRSIDGGKTWRMIDTRMMDGSPRTSIAFHPIDPNVIYASGDRGFRISTDAGITWQRVVDPPPWGDTPVTAIATDPEQTGFLLVGVENRVFRSTDGGKTWRGSNAVDGSPMRIYVDPRSRRENRRCFLATVNGVYRSDDGGLNWQKRTKGLPWVEIRDFAAGADFIMNRTVLYVTIPSRIVDGSFDGGVYRSFDLGDTWKSAMGSGINTDIGLKDDYGQGEIAQYYFIDCGEARASTVYVTNTGTGYWPPYHFTVYRSYDAGDQWQYCLNGDLRFMEHNVENGWIALDMSWGWGGDALGLEICSTDPEVVAFTNSGEIYITRDGGKSWRCAYSQPASGTSAPGRGGRWQSIGLEVTTTWHYYVDPHDPRRHYICYTDIGFARSLDGGKTWSLSVTGSPWRNTFYQLAIDPDTPALMWAAAANQHDIGHWSNIDRARPGGGVVVTRDAGRTWEKSSSGLPDLPAVSIVIDPNSPRNKRRLWVAMFGDGVYRSDDGGKSWQRKSNGLGNPGNNHVYSLRLHKDGTLFCSITGKRDGSVFAVPGGLWFSKDGGDSWECATKNLDVYWVMEYAVDPENSSTIYLCGSDAPRLGGGGLYRTDDLGSTWHKIEVDFPSEYLSYVHAFAPIIHPENRNLIFLTTNTHGIFLSEDGGENWSEWKVIPFLGVHRLEFNPLDSDEIYITTFGGGVWKVKVKTESGK